MKVPSSTELQLPILQYLDDEKPHTIREVTDKMAEHFELTPEQKEERTVVSNSLKFYGRCTWAVSSLRIAGLLKNLERGVFQITEQGLEVLKEKPSIINEKLLMRFQTYKDWSNKTKTINKITKKKEKEKIKKKFGLVAFIDVLGIKGIWRRENSEDIPTIWNQFTSKFKQIVEVTMDKQTKVEFYSFSDTIVITLEHQDNDYLLSKFGSAVWRSIVQSIKIGLPVRGCFALGEFFQEGNFFIGEAVDEASQYYNLPQWIGISASPSAHQALEILSKKNPDAVNPIYIKCMIPLKQSIEQNAWAINWPELLSLTNSDSINENKTLQTILEKIDSNLENLTDIDASLKWRNTRKFCDDVLSDS